MKRLLHILLWICVGGLILFSVFRICFPLWLERHGFPMLAQALNVEALRGEIRQFSWGRIDLGSVELISQGQVVLRLPSLRADFTCEDGMVVFDRIQLTGAEVRVHWRNGQWSVPGIYPDLLTTSGASEKTQSSDGGSVPVALRRIELEHCMVLLQTDRSSLEIPFSGGVDLPEAGKSELELEWKLSLAGDYLQGRGSFDLAAGAFDLEGAGMLTAEYYHEWLPIPLTGKGEFTFKGDLDADSSTGEISFKNGTYQLGALTVIPGQLIWAGVTGELKVSLDQWSLQGWNGQIDLARFEGFWRKGQLSGNAVWQGSWGEIRLPEAHWKGDVEIADLELKEVSAVSSLTLPEYPGFFLELEVAGDASIMLWEGRVQAKLPQWAGMVGGESVTVNAPEVAVNFRWQDQIPSGEAVFSVASIDYGAVSAGAVTGKIFSNNYLNGASLSLSGGDLVYPAFRLEKFLIELPWHWQGCGAESGKLKAGPLFMGDVELLGLNGHIQQIANGATWNIDVATPFLPDWSGKLLGAVDWEKVLKAEAELEIPEFSLPSALQISELVPTVSVCDWEGTLRGRGKLQWQGGLLAGNADLALRLAQFSLPESGLEMEDLELNLALPRLPALESLPEQSLRVREIRFGEWKFPDASVVFQLEPDGVFLESLGIGCCGGRIMSQALRLRYGDTELSGILYADHLNLAEVITTVGLAEAKGTGTVFGKIPFHLRANGIEFEPGFLYSEPGESSRVEITGLESMLTALPPETAEAAQLALAAEALKSFEYSWAKVELVSQGDALDLVFKFNGRPDNVLPFVFDQNAGRFVRVDAGGSEFESIRFDVNSSLPLGEIWRLSEYLQPILGGK